TGLSFYPTELVREKVPDSSRSRATIVVIIVQRDFNFQLIVVFMLPDHEVSKEGSCIGDIDHVSVGSPDVEKLANKAKAKFRNDGVNLGNVCCGCHSSLSFLSNG